MPIFEHVSPDLPVALKTKSYSVIADDNGSEIQFEKTTAVTADLPAVDDVANGFNVILRNIGAGDLTIQPASEETIDGETSLTLEAGDWRWIRNDGTEWKSISSSSASDQEITLTGDVTGTGTGSIVTTIANDAVTYAKMQNVSAASKLLGRGDSGSGDPQEISLGSGLSMSGTTLSASGGGGQAASPNLIYNPDFAISQRGSTFTVSTPQANNDDTYVFDRWVLLSDTNNVVNLAQDPASAPPLGKNTAKFVVQTANKKFGLVQILEANVSKSLKSLPVSLSFQVRKGSGNATLETIRVGILEWTGTADTVPSDVVNSWNSAGTNPTLTTNWAYKNSPADITLTSSYQTVTVDNISLGSGISNLAIFVWIDDTDATANDELYLGNFKIEQNVEATAYTITDITTELVRCERFFQTWVGGMVGVGSSTMVSATGRFPINMRVTPTAIARFEVTLSDDHAINYVSSGISIVTQPASNKGGRFVSLGGFSGLTTASSGNSVIYDWVNGELWLDAEL